MNSCYEEFVRVDCEAKDLEIVEWLRVKSEPEIRCQVMGLEEDAKNDGELEKNRSKCPKQSLGAEITFCHQVILAIFQPSLGFFFVCVITIMANGLGGCNKPSDSVFFLRRFGFYLSPKTAQNVDNRHLHILSVILRQTSTRDSVVSLLYKTISALFRAKANSSASARETC
jgi:hypothetical protein